MHKFAPNPADNSLVLFLGADGCGKSTTIELVAASLQDVSAAEVLEQTKSPELLAFKLANVKRIVEKGYIDEREQLFEASNRQFVALIEDSRKANNYTLLDGHPLITAVSHDLMRQIVGAEDSQERHLNPAVLTEALGEICLPSLVVYLYVEESERISRITARDSPEEVLWGFNSPYFLEQYQRTLHRSAVALTEGTASDILEFNTGEMSALEISSIVVDRVT
jgi:thymidylate kinase